MEEMTMARLSDYSILAAQKQRIETEYNMPSYISGVDTSKPAVQSGKISDVTADIAIMQLNIPPAIKAEYERICKELRDLDIFINGISNELIKAIAIRHFVLRESFHQIGIGLFMDRKKASKLLTDYVQKIPQNTPKSQLTPYEV